jgi:hypothetical protein
MNTHPKIHIKKAPGSEPTFTDGSDLIHLFFQARDNGREFRFHHTDGSKIHTEPHHLVSGTDFTFKIDKVCWSVTNFRVWEQPAGVFNASGSWSTQPCKANGEVDGEETGTFQAQSGGSGNPELEASATASA